LIFPLLWFGCVPDVYGFIEFLDDFVAEGSIPFKPAIILLSQQVDDLQEDAVILLALIFGELCQSLVDITGFSGEFFPQRERLIQGNYF
jgi:hypothetical protein